MAFVSTAPRKLDSSHNEEFPSPAHYQIKLAEPVRQCAPFRSTSLRKVAFSQNCKDQPGPGQYNVAKQIIKPKITAYANTNNIIIKVNSTGTPQFKSLTKRFNHQKQQEQIGELQYATQLKKSLVRKDKIRSTIKNPASKALVTLLSKSTRPSIPAKVHGLSNPETQSRKFETIQPGPADYEVKVPQRSLAQGAIWAKDKIKRFDESKISNNGPGYYEISYNPEKKRQDQSYNFKSGTVRTFFDTIMYNSCSEYIAERRKKIDFKSPLPAPGQYGTQSSFDVKGSKPAKFQFFGSSIQRFQSSLPQSSHPQQFYVPKGFGGNKSFNHSNPAFNSHAAKSPSFLSSQQLISNPGPGEYQDKAEPLRLKVGKKVEKFGSTAERIPQNPKQNLDELVQQHESEVQLQNQLLKSRFGQLQTESSMFKSKTNRVCFSETKNNTINLDYDLTYNDVAKRIQRQKQYLDNLRRVQVYKPPFQVNTPRFPHYQPWGLIQKQQKQPTQEKSSAKKTLVNNKIVSVGGKIGKQQRFKSQRKGGGIPGVGNYGYESGWKNNSFNIMFK